MKREELMESEVTIKISIQNDSENIKVLKENYNVCNNKVKFMKNKCKRKF